MSTTTSAAADKKRNISKAAVIDTVTYKAAGDVNQTDFFSGHLPVIKRITRDTDCVCWSHHHQLPGIQPSVTAKEGIQLYCVLFCRTAVLVVLIA